MKNLILILMLFPAVCVAQSNAEGSILNKPQNAIAQTNQHNLSASADYLEKAGKGLVGSSLMYLVGAASLWFGNEIDSDPLKIGGGVIFGGAFFIQIKAFDDIRRSGKYMKP